MIKFESGIDDEIVAVCAVCKQKIEKNYCKYKMPGNENAFYVHNGKCKESFENSAISGNVDFTTRKVTVSDFEKWYNGIYNGYIGNNYDAIKQAYFAGKGAK